MEDDGGSWVHRLVYRLLVTLLRAGNLPRHVGFVMDGNRRYARQHHTPTKEGHTAGFSAMSQILELSYAVGIPEVSVYAFSIENFNRTQEEVEDLMAIARSRLHQLAERGDLADKHGVRIRIVGNVALLPQDVREVALDIAERTKLNTRATLNLCMPYTARDDITQALRTKLTTDPGPNMTAQSIEQAMYTGNSPPLDLLVRTSNTHRLSDFFLWEAVRDSTYIDFVSQLWPEYTPWSYSKTLLRWGYAQWAQKGSTQATPSL